jgi:putative addiction module component (TIGR02574 family)
MVDFNSVLSAAKQLSEGEQLRLIDELWKLAPDDADFPLDASWKGELERRVAGVNAGTAKLTSWNTIREESLRRIESVDGN